MTVQKKNPRNNFVAERAWCAQVSSVNHKMMLTTNDYGRSQNKYNDGNSGKSVSYFVLFLFNRCCCTLYVVDSLLLLLVFCCCCCFRFIELITRGTWNYTVCTLLVATTQYQQSKWPFQVVSDIVNAHWITWKLELVVLHTHAHTPLKITCRQTD